MDYEHRMRPFTECARSTYLYYLPAASFAFPPHSPSSVRGHQQLLELLSKQFSVSISPPWDAPPPGNSALLSFTSARALFRCHFTGKAFPDDLDIPVSSFCLLTLLSLPSLSNSSLVDLLVYYLLSFPPS